MFGGAGDPDLTNEDMWALCHPTAIRKRERNLFVYPAHLAGESSRERPRQWSPPSCVRPVLAGADSGWTDHGKATG